MSSPTEAELESARKIINTAEAAARHLISEAAVVAAQLKATASNGQHEQIRADIKGVADSVSVLSTCVLNLQRGQLRILGGGSLVGAIALFLASRVLGA